MNTSVRISFLAASLLAVLCACSDPQLPHPGASTDAPAGGPSSQPIMLYTHCGIEEVRVDDTFFIAETPLHDGQGNPPPGWGNPYQAGTVTVSGSQAVFEDGDGHVVTFEARPGATSFVKTCS